MVGSLTPIRVRHVHLAGGTGETRSPSVAGQHTSTATSLDVCDVVLYPVARQSSDHRSGDG